MCLDDNIRKDAYKWATATREVKPTWIRDSLNICTQNMERPFLCRHWSAPPRLLGCTNWCTKRLQRTYTLQGTNISQLRKRKIIIDSKVPCQTAWGYVMLVSRRVLVPNSLCMIHQSGFLIWTRNRFRSENSTRLRAPADIATTNVRPWEVLHHDRNAARIEG